MVIVALLIIVRAWKQTRCSSIEKLVKKIWYIYTMEHYLVVKKDNDIMKFAGKWMELEKKSS